MFVYCVVPGCMCDQLTHGTTQHSQLDYFLTVNVAPFVVETSHRGMFFVILVVQPVEFLCSVLFVCTNFLVHTDKG